MSENAIPRLAKARSELERLARAVLRIASSGDVTSTPVAGRRTVNTRTRHSAGRDAVEIEWGFGNGMRSQAIDAFDELGRVEIGLVVPDDVIDPSRQIHRVDPNQIAHVLDGLLAMLGRESLQDGRLALPWERDDTTWRSVCAEAERLSDAHPGVEVRISQERGRIHLDTFGDRGETPSGAAIEMASSLQPLSILTWDDACSAQALVKRRTHGIPPMGRAELARAPLKWKKPAGAAKAASSTSPVAIVRAPVSLVSMPDEIVEERFTWHLEHFEAIDNFVEEDPETRAALVRSVHVNGSTKLEAPVLIKRGSRWKDMGVPTADRFEVTQAEMDVLVRAGYFVESGWRGEFAWSASWNYHSLLQAVAGSGYTSLEGVRELRSEELVPVGLPHRDSASFFSVGLGPLTPTASGYEHPPYHHFSYSEWPYGGRPRNLRTDDMIDIAIAADHIHPDHGDLVRDGKQFRTALDPSLDDRILAGPLARLYRMPLADRVLTARYLASRRMLDGLRIESWRDR